ncbi:unnamed protein product [Schistosoma margrebowiei]|uniref:Uncharacterized protein n=1 Tax=Schistosoma margrebowiei TaxID=48269 RepID=A0A183MHV5_9TREM|nr:unnamed protein product [Schistosoma margrebowiei]
MLYYIFLGYDNDLSVGSLMEIKSSQHQSSDKANTITSLNHFMGSGDGQCVQRAGMELAEAYDLHLSGISRS